MNRKERSNHLNQCQRRNGKTHPRAQEAMDVRSYRGKLKRRLRGYPRQPQDILDLHRRKYQEAMNMLTEFIREAVAARLKTVRVITGRGLHSNNGKANLREATAFRLEQFRLSRMVHDYKLEEFSKGGSYMVYLRG